MSRTVTCTTASISRATKAGYSSRKLTDDLAETENDSQMDEASNVGTAERLNWVALNLRVSPTAK